MSNTPTSKFPDLTRLEKRLDYSFKNRRLLEQALTHKSHSRSHNERLEFLGDAVLGYVIADVLYAEHGSLAEDALTLLRARLVRKETLGELGRDLGLGDYLRLGSGERKSGGRKRESILADGVEALIGAVSLDGGVEAARNLILAVYRSRLDDVREQKILAVKDPKTRLQEYLQARAVELPEYEVAELGGSEHARSFTVVCRVKSLQLETTGSGSSRRGAEKAAAAEMIERINEID